MTTAIDTSCQHCGAEPGTVCTTNKGEQREPHRARIKAAEKLKDYLAYWARNPGRHLHKAKCPNPSCNAELKFNRPKDDEDEWDSLAECPYCHGMFFYVSKQSSIELYYKGKM